MADQFHARFDVMYDVLLEIIPLLAFNNFNEMYVS